MITHKKHTQLLTQQQEYYAKQVAFLIEEIYSRDEVTRKALSKYADNHWGTRKTMLFLQRINQKAVNRLRDYLRRETGKLQLPEKQP